jgi:rhodanese-related sulfurtransferase
MFLRLALLLLLASPASAGDDYLVYLHGRIVEGSDGRPVHPEYGVYDHPAIVQAFENVGFTVLSEIRPADTDGLACADRVADQVDSLIALGIEPKNISVVGMSKGGGIALATSMKLARSDVNFVFLGTCVGQPQNMPPIVLRGRILMIHEMTDQVTRPCTDKTPTLDPGLVFRRLRTNTGLGHGAFYRPDPVWMDPVIAWCRGDDTKRSERVQKMYEDYRSDFASAAEVGTDSLAAWLSTDRAILVDVREKKERAVSRIPGAITREEFETGNYADRRIVAYCTIGYRSGKYAERLREAGLDAWNLSAGILGWVHDFRPVEHEGIEVRRVHVYGGRWSLLPEWYESVW